MPLNKLLHFNYGCSACDLCKPTKHICYPGVGNSKNPKLIVIRDFPSVKEDKKRHRFKKFEPPLSYFDQQADIITGALKESGISVGNRGEVYGTYAVKCCPGYDKPKVKDARICINKYLTEEIKILKPKAILLLGKTVQQFITGNSMSLNKTHGKLFDYKKEYWEGKVFIIEHPFSILSSPAKYVGWVADLRRLKAFLNNEESPYWNSEKLKRYTFVPILSLAKLREVVDSFLESSRNFEYLAYDVETSGLDFELFNSDYKLYSIQFGFIDINDVGNNDKLPVYFVPIESSQFKVCSDTGWVEGVREQLKKLFNSNDFSALKTVAHNAKFDLKVLHQFGVPTIGEWCTMMLWSNLYGEASMSLKEIAYTVTDLGGYDSVIDTYFKEKGTFDAPPELLIPYGCLDIVILRHLFYKLYNTILKEDKKKHG
jgi:uracil-DNA glycosylase family 4